MKLSLTILLTFLLFGSQIKGQNYYESVFPDLDGNTLSSALRNKYKPSRTLSYSAARDKMYGEIDNKNGKLTCIYTGYTINISGNGGVRSEAYNKGINCEHSWPQSKGATGNAKSDMHHLFPTRIDINSDRGSLPFGEINDNVTDRWYKGTTSRSSKPTSSIDDYSELDYNKEFEPREDIKGDIARAAFYFKTMYSSANTSFFNAQVDDLCDWHLEDPVDQKEWDRNTKIAKYQQGKKNPFVLDCSIARLYCKNVTTDCFSGTVSVKDEKMDMDIKPNPAYDFIELEVAERSTLKIMTYRGRLLKEYQLDTGLNKVDVSNLNKGIYVLKVYNTYGKNMNTDKFIKL